MATYGIISLKRNSPDSGAGRENLWPPEARWLHAGIAVGVTIQLFSSLWMTPDWQHADYASFTQLLFSFHAWVGLTTALFLLWQWLWIATSARVRQQFFPLMGPWQPVFNDLRLLLHGKLQSPGPASGLAVLIHGLGLLLVSWMALTGTVIFFFLPQGGTPPGVLLQNLIPLHKALSNLVWAYWLGHVVMFIVHLLRRDRILDIFRLGS